MVLIAIVVVVMVVGKVKIKKSSVLMIQNEEIKVLKTEKSDSVKPELKCNRTRQ